MSSRQQRCIGISTEVHYCKSYPSNCLVGISQCIGVWLAFLQACSRCFTPPKRRWTAGRAGCGPARACATTGTTSLASRKPTQWTREARPTTLPRSPWPSRMLTTCVTSPITSPTPTRCCRLVWAYCARFRLYSPSIHPLYMGYTGVCRSRREFGFASPSLEQGLQVGICFGTGYTFRPFRLFLLFYQASPKYT